MDKPDNSIEPNIENRNDLKDNLVEFIDFLPDPTFIINKEGIIIAWNPAMEELTNTKAKNMVGKGNYEHTVAIWGKRRPMLIDVALRSKEEIKRKYSFFLRNKEKDILSINSYVKYGKPKGLYLWVKARPLYNFKKEIIGAIQIIQDITELKSTEKDLKNSEKRLKERIKELNCLYGIIRLVTNPNISLVEILRSVINLIQEAMVLPKITCVRLSFNGKEYKTSNYINTQWKISNKVKIKNKNLVIDIHYLRKKTFLKEEKELLTEICNQLKSIFEFKLIWI